MPEINVSSDFMVIDDNLSPEELADMAEMKPEDERCKVGKCPYCGKLRNDLLPTKSGTLRCADCDSLYRWCSICNEEQSDDDHCRHIFKSEDGEWMGSGTHMYEYELEYVRISFFLLLDLMPEGFAQALRIAIFSGEFHTWACLPLIGGGGSLELSGMPRREGQWVNFWWGDFLMEIGSGPDSEDTSDAYHWLASLYNKKTPAANKITLRWLDQYIAIERAARIWGRSA